MIRSRLVSLVFILAVAMSGFGCASIVDGRDKQVKLNSTPPGARVTVFNKSGAQVASETTPAVLRLPRNHGVYTSETYNVRFDLTGYYPSEITIDTKLNGWYFGNILFGGAIGLALVDPMTGAMWTLSPTDVNRTLVSSAVTLSPEELHKAELEANPPKTSKSGNTAKTPEKQK
jgi:hypothetical protein